MELLAPAGELNTAIAAFQAGADACYIGGEMSARAYAKNFSREEVGEALRLARLWGRKLYVALNTMIFEEEMEQALEYAGFLYDLGVDAVIVSDLGLVRNLRGIYPHLPIHLSTQAGVHTASGAELARELGCARIVAARECTFQQLETLAKTGVEVEAFCHGALCSSVSGMCLMSSFIGGRSGNRGRCAQPCRMEYMLEGERAYWLSTADLCTIESLSKFIDAGVCSLKIEGRMKRPEYVSVVVKAYRKALDGTGNTARAIFDMKRVYNRGNFTEGYGNGSTDVTYIQRQNHIGVPVGRVTKLEKGRALLQTNVQMTPGDGIEYVGNRSRGGLTLPYADKAKGGYWLKALPGVQVGDQVFRTTDVRQRQEIEREWQNTPQLLVDMEFSGRRNEQACLTLQAQGVTVTVRGETCQEARNPADEERIRRQLAKTGRTPFSPNKIDINIDKDIYLSMSNINGMRREGLSQLEQAILARRRPYASERGALPSLRVRAKESYVAAQVRTWAQAQAAWQAGADRVYYCPRNMEVPEGRQGELWMVLPPYLPEEEQAQMMAMLREKKDRYDGMVAGNLGQLKGAQQLCGEKVLADVWLNTGNRAGVSALQPYGRATVSLEADLYQIAALEGQAAEAVIFGHVPVMNLRHCPFKKRGKCPHCEGASLQDRKGYRFSCARIGGRECLLQLLNPVCLAFTRLTQLRQAGITGYRLMFYYESEDMVAQVTRRYQQAVAEGTDVALRDIMEETGNTGHFYRGVL